MSSSYPVRPPETFEKTHITCLSIEERSTVPVEIVGSVQKEFSKRGYLSPCNFSNLQIYAQSSSEFSMRVYQIPLTLGFADVNAAQRRRDGYLQRLRIGIAVFRLFSCFHVGQESSQTALDQCGSLL